MSTATNASKREGMPETWPVETRGGEPIFSKRVRDDLRVGGVVHALEVLAVVQAAVCEHLERAYEKLEHEGVRHTVAFTVEHVGAAKRDLRKAADLYWMERNEEVEVSEWPYTGITYRVEREDPDRPHLSLDEVDVRHLIVDLYRIASAAAKGDDMTWDHSMLRNCMEAIGLKAERILADIEESAGMEISDDDRAALFDIASPWGEKALNLGREAVDTDRGGIVSPTTAEPDNQVYMPGELVALLHDRAASVRAAGKDVDAFAGSLGRRPCANIAFGAGFTLEKIADRLVDVTENPEDHALPDGGMEHAIIMTASQLFMVAASLDDPMPQESRSEELVAVVRDLAHSTWALYEQVAERIAEWKANGKPVSGS